jgi:hypothetical protein
MSINNIEKNFGNDHNIYAGGSKFFDEKTGTYKDVTSSFEEENVSELIQKKMASTIPSEADYALREEYFIPLNFVRNQINEANLTLNKIVSNIDNILDKIYVDPTVDFNLEESHIMVWKELIKYNSPTASQIELADEVNPKESPYRNLSTGEFYDIDVLYPSYISFQEYLYAKRSGSLISKRLIKEYNRVISHSVFSYLVDLRDLVKYMINEAFTIKQVLQNSFGEDYEDDSQKQVGVRFDSWAKMAMHYAQRIASLISSRPREIPTSEVDQISEKQAVEFQAFFAIRLDAVDGEIKSSLESLRKDYVDNCDIFYSRYLEQAIMFKAKMVAPMELDFYTTTFSQVAPSLTDELVIAANVINANFGMIMTDMIQRNQMITSKTDLFLRLIEDKRRYCNYIFQLSGKGKSKAQIIKPVSKDPYRLIFKSATYGINIESDLLSNHGSLDNLHEDHHPQYLLKNGGTITGDIFVENEATIDGVHLSTHAHTGFDGSERIKSTDIDYNTPRENFEIQILKPISISIDSFIPDIIDGGIPVMDVVVAITTLDENSNLEYEIIIAEVD